MAAILPGTGSRDVPDIEFARYPACRISGRSKSRIPDIRPDIRPYIRHFENNNCLVSNKSLRYCQILEDTGTGYEYFPRVRFSQHTNLALISGRISGLAGYRISGKAYPVSGRIPDLKKWPDTISG